MTEQESKLVPAARLHDLMREMDEVLAMTVASIKTLRARNPKSNPKSKM